MKKRLLSILITVIALVPFILSAFAFSDDEALVRKRAYYAGIENSLSLLSQNLGALENVQIQKIVVRSPKDLTTETAVKEFTVKQSQKFFSFSPLIKVFIQFSASENGIQQDYLLNHTLSLVSIYDLAPLNAPEQSKFGSSRDVYYIALEQLDSDNGRLVAPGAAYYGGDYYFDIDLSDYQNTGHSLSIPLQQSDESTTALFPLIRKRAYYRNIEQGLSRLGELRAYYGLSNAQVKVKRIIVASSSDCTSEADVDKALEAYANKRLTLTSPPIEISILYSASDGNNTQDYVFTYVPSRPSAVLPNQFSSSPDDRTTFLTSFNKDASRFNNYGECLAPGIAYSSIIGSYYLDIDLNDYQSSGYSLVIA